MLPREPYRNISALSQGARVRELMSFTAACKRSRHLARLIISIALKSGNVEVTVFKTFARRLSEVEFSRLQAALWVLKNFPRNEG